MASRLPYDGPVRLGGFIDPAEASPGFFKVRMVKGAAEIGARLFKIEQRDAETGDLIADVRYIAEVDGKTHDGLDPPRWPWTPIAQAEYEFLIADAQWCRLWKPNSPRANPYLPASFAPAEYY